MFLNHGRMIFKQSPEGAEIKYKNSSNQINSQQKVINRIDVRRPYHRLYEVLVAPTS